MIQITYLLATLGGAGAFEVVECRGSAHSPEFGHIANRDWADVLPISSYDKFQGTVGSSAAPSTAVVFLEVAGHAQAPLPEELANSLASSQYVKVRQAGWEALESIISCAKGARHIELFACSLGAAGLAPVHVPSLAMYLCASRQDDLGCLLSCDTLTLRLPCCHKVLANVGGPLSRAFVQGEGNRLSRTLAQQFRFRERGELYVHQATLDGSALAALISMPLKSITLEDSALRGDLGPDLPVCATLREFRCDLEHVSVDQFVRLLRHCPSIEVLQVPRIRITSRTFRVISSLPGLVCLDLRNVKGVRFSGSPILEGVRMVIAGHSLGRDKAKIRKHFPNAELVLDFPDV